MRVTLEIWQLVTLCIVLAGAYAGVVKLLLNQQIKHIDGALYAIRKDSEQWAALEREFLEFKAELSLNFVRRDDYVRNQTVIEAKLDRIASEVKVVQIQQGAAP